MPGVRLCLPVGGPKLDAMRLEAEDRPQLETHSADVGLSRRMSLEGLAVFLILPILLLGAYFRFTGLNWDEFTHLHPDERFLTIVASGLSSPDNPLDYLRTSVSTLNPYNLGQPSFVYGNFPMTVTRYVAEWTAALCQTLTGADGIPPAWCGRDYTGYDGVHLVGRFLSALVDLVAVLLTFLIGRRLYGTAAGLIAALLLALAVMPIQQSHFFTMDNWAAALTTLAIYAAIRAAALDDPNLQSSNLQSPNLSVSQSLLPPWRLRWFALFGLALGLAMASRINIAPLALVIGISAMIWLARRGLDFPSLFSNLGHPDVQRMILSIVVAAFVSALTFRLAQPYAFTDSELVRQQAMVETGQSPGVLMTAVRSVIGLNPQWLSNMAEIQRLQAPEASFPPANQWVDRTAILFPLTNMILYGMGITAGLFSWFCLLWALWRVIRQRPSWNNLTTSITHSEWMAHAIPLFWTLLYFLFMGTRWVKSIRYFLPIYPTLFLFAGWGLVFLWQWARRSRGAGEQGSGGERRFGWRRAAVLGLGLLVVVPSLLWANAFTEIYRQPMTRVAASNWIFENIPTGLTLLYEDEAGTAKELQLPVKAFFFEANGVPLLLDFTMPESGTITGVRFNYLSDPDGDTADEGESLLVQLNDGPAAELSLELGADEETATLELPPLPVTAEQPIHLVAEASAGGPIRARTSLLVNEEWDDLLPVSTQGRNAYGAYYTEVTGGQRPVTHPDSPEKLGTMLTWIDEADYIMLSSQRALWSLPRLALTFPMTVRYYESLFSGELGFDLVAQFHGDIHVGPLYISDTGGRLRWRELPQIGWPPPGDLAAEEAFSVYDHPPVWIFAKSDRYSAENAERILGSVDLSQVVVMNPLEATRARNGLMLSSEAAELQQAGGTFSELFNPDSLLNRSPAVAAILWWLATILLGWLAFPLTFVALRGLPERGYALSRVLGMLLLSYIPWLLASLNVLPHTRTSLLLALVLIVAGSGLILWRRGREIIPFVRQNLAYIGLVELLAVSFYLLMIFIRLGNPDVWHVFWGGEKPMDLSFFTAVLKSTTFPPYDPWFAGGYLNYYYYGFVFVGALTKLLGIMPTIAYNLILPTLFSFIAVGVFSLAYSLVISRGQEAEGQRSRGAGENLQSPISNLQSPSLLVSQSLSRRAVVAGLAAAVMATILGNLAQVGVIAGIWQAAGSESLARIPLIGGVARILDGGIKILGGQPAPVSPSTWFWDASRAINYNPGEVAPITEFPYFTFLYGDLHAHMISIPLTLLALGWAISLVLQSPLMDGRKSWLETGWQWLLGGLAIGSLRATNTWDWPTYLVIGALAVAFFVYRRYQRIDIRTVGTAVLLMIALVGLSMLTFLPYAANYGTGYSSASLWPGTYTYLTNYLVIYGLFLFLTISYLFVEFRDWTASWSAAGLRRLEPFGRLLIFAAILYVLALVAMFFRNYWIAPLVVTLITMAGLLGLRPNLSPTRRIWLILLACGLGLTLLVEIFVLDGDIGRMNTVFKFYMQVWIFLSILSGVAAVWVWPVVRRKASFGRVWQVALGVLLFAAALYPLTATKAKWEIRMSEDAPTTLDGMAFMPYTSYGDTDYAGNGVTVELAHDYEALRWLQRNVEGSPVIAEAHGSNPYQTISNRVAMYTGLPTIVGWDWHERQQRAVTPGHLVSTRIENVNLLYRTPDITQAQTILEKYDVEYIFVGSLERTYYHPDGLAKFEQMVSEGYLTIAYQDAYVTIYRVNQNESQQALQ